MKANWKEAPHDAETYRKVPFAPAVFCKPGNTWNNLLNKWIPDKYADDYAILEHRPRIIAWKDMKKGMVVRCTESSGAWYEEGQECLVGLDGHNDFGPLNSRGYISDRPELYTFELVSEPEPEEQDPRICIDVRGFDEDKNRRVIDAFYELEYEWAIGEKYKHLDVSEYTNVGMDGSYKEELMFGNISITEAQKQYEHTYEQLMQRAYGDAGHPDEPEQRKTVKDAVDDHNFTWPFPRGDKLYFHKARGKYICLSKSLDESQGYYFICTREQFEAELNSTNQQEKLSMQEPEWTHQFDRLNNSRKLAILSNTPDKNGEIAIIKDTPHGLVYSKCKPNQIKPLPKPISKAEAYDWLVSQMYGTGGDVPAPNMNRLWEDLHTQFQVIPEDN